MHMFDATIYDKRMNRVDGERERKKYSCIIIIIRIEYANEPKSYVAKIKID